MSMTDGTSDQNNNGAGSAASNLAAALLSRNPNSFHGHRIQGTVLLFRLQNFRGPLPEAQQELREEHARILAARREMLSESEEQQRQAGMAGSSGPQIPSLRDLAPDE